MNRLFFPKARYMIGVGFKILAHPYQNYPLSYPPPPRVVGRACVKYNFHMSGNALALILMSNLTFLIS